MVDTMHAGLLHHCLTQNLHRLNNSFVANLFRSLPIIYLARDFPAAERCVGVYQKECNSDILSKTTVQQRRLAQPLSLMLILPY